MRMRVARIILFIGSLVVALYFGYQANQAAEHQGAWTVDGISPVTYKELTIWSVLCAICSILCLFTGHKIWKDFDFGGRLDRRRDQEFIERTQERRVQDEIDRKAWERSRQAQPFHQPVTTLGLELKLDQELIDEQPFQPTFRQVLSTITDVPSWPAT